MAYFRISELPDAPPPVVATSLIEISSPNNTTVSGYDSHKITITNLFTDISLGGNIFVPTYPPGTNNNLVASTEYVDRAVNNTISYVDGNFLRLTGGTVTGDTTFGNSVNIVNHLQVTSVSVSNNLDVNGRAALMLVDFGDSEGTRKGYVDGTSGGAAFDGYVTVGDLRSNLNIYVPNGWGSFGQYVEAYGDIITHQGFYTYGTGDVGPSTTRGGFGSRRWRFMQNAGDAAEAGTIDYRGYDAGALSIVGAGGSPRRVKIYDFLDVTGGGYFGGPVSVLGTAEIFQRATMWAGATVWGSDNFEVRSDSGAARTRYRFADRVWTCGVVNTGRYQIGDETVGVARLQIDLSGICFNTTGTWQLLSARDLKQDIVPYEDAGLAAVTALRPVRFRYRAGTPFAPPGEPGAVQIGLLAEDVKEHLPEICGEFEIAEGERSRSVATIAPGLLVYPMLNALREIAERLAAVEEKLDAG